LKARKLSRAITPAEFELDTEEWKKICDENKGVRILEGGKKLVQYDYDFYDDELIKFTPPDWQKVSKMMHNLFSKSKQTTGDAYLLWRLKKMVEAGKLDARGEVKNMKDFEVKAKTSQTEPVPGSGVYVSGEQT
jgi:hypothetical protein